MSWWWNSAQDHQNNLRKKRKTWIITYTQHLTLNLLLPFFSLFCFHSPSAYQDDPVGWPMFPPPGNRTSFGAENIIEFSLNLSVSMFVHEINKNVLLKSCQDPPCVASYYHIYSVKHEVGYIIGDNSHLYLAVITYYFTPLNALMFSLLVNCSNMSRSRVHVFFLAMNEKELTEWLTNEKYVGPTSSLRLCNPLHSQGWFWNEMFPGRIKARVEVRLARFGEAVLITTFTQVSNMFVHSEENITWNQTELNRIGKNEGQDWKAL